jgi:hypothetical protein
MRNIAHVNLHACFVIYPPVLDQRVAFNIISVPGETIYRAARFKPYRSSAWSCILRLRAGHAEKYQIINKTGKPAKLPLTAIMRKLIELAKALIKHNRNGRLNRLEKD